MLNTFLIILWRLGSGIFDKAIAFYFGDECLQEIGGNDKVEILPICHLRKTRQ